ncbi:hypothetical protein ACRAWD_16985 [Caulobacter segnis]
MLLSRRADPQGNCSTGLGIGRHGAPHHPVRRADGRVAGGRRPP